MGVRISWLMLARNALLDGWRSRPLLGGVSLLLGSPALDDFRAQFRRAVGHRSLQRLQLHPGLLEQMPFLSQGQAELQHLDVVERLF